jgi:hypothetical protein
MKEISIPRFLLPDLSLAGRLEIELLALSEMRCHVLLGPANTLPVRLI